MKAHGWMYAVLIAGTSLGLGLATPRHATVEQASGDPSFQVAQYNQTYPRDSRSQRWRRERWSQNSVMVPRGTNVAVTVRDQLSTEESSVGDGWTGTVDRPVIVDGRIVIPAGSTVYGRVTEVVPARSGQRARLGLAVESVDRNGRSYPMHAYTEPLVGGSGRARNLGIIAGGAAVGAVAGHAIGGGKGTLIGGLLGGLAGGAYAKHKGGYDLAIKHPVTLDFVLDESVAMRT